MKSLLSILNCFLIVYLIKQVDNAWLTGFFVALGVYGLLIYIEVFIARMKDERRLRGDAP